MRALRVKASVAKNIVYFKYNCVIRPRTKAQTKATKTRPPLDYHRSTDEVSTSLGL